MLSPAQLQSLKASIASDPVLAAMPKTPDAAYEIAALYNLAASPDFWVWRTSVSRAEIYNTTSADSTTWSWTIYKNQSVPEQNAWTQIFMGDQADFSRANVRAGIDAIFGAGNANTAHAKSVGRRKATRAEKLFATGTGSAVSPAAMSFEGSINYIDVETARNLP